MACRVCCARFRRPGLDTRESGGTQGIRYCNQSPPNGRETQRPHKHLSRVRSPRIMYMGWNVAVGGRVNMTTAPGTREITPMPGPPFCAKPTIRRRSKAPGRPAAHFLIIHQDSSAQTHPPTSPWGAGRIPIGGTAPPNLVGDVWLLLPSGALSPGELTGLTSRDSELRHCD